MRLDIEDSIYKDPRYQDLMVLLGNKFTALGMLVSGWTMAQKYWLAHRGIPTDKWPSQLDPLITVGLAVKQGELIYVCGSKEKFLWLEQKQLAGQKSAEARRVKSNIEPSTHVQRPPTADNGGEPLSLSLSLPLKKKKIQIHKSSAGVENRPTDGEGRDANRACWDAYRQAYFEKYEVEPVRNVTVNSQIANFVKRVGGEDAPEIVRFYLKHNDAKYLKNTHSFGFCLMDAETLRTQWMKNQPITSLDVRRFEKKVEQSSVRISQADVDEINRRIAAENAKKNGLVEWDR